MDRENVPPWTAPDVPSDAPPSFARDGAGALVAVATYNERENLPQLVDRIFQFLPRAHLLVVDDGSPDGTGDWVDERAAADPRVRCLHRAGKLGLGTATIAGLRHALQNGYACAITMDADFSHDPRHLPELMETLARGADVAIGSRYVDGGRIEGWPWQRRWISRCVNGFARRWLRLPVRDTSGAYRAYRAEILRRVALETVRAKGYAVFEELLFVLRRAGARFEEVPITFVDRQFGQSKVSWREAVRSLWHLVTLPFRR
jgi:dolichol-phosphate mannosyltransferase